MFPSVFRMDVFLLCVGSEHLGCFKETSHSRALRGQRRVDWGRNSVDVCLDLCRDTDEKTYAGVKVETDTINLNVYLLCTFLLCLIIINNIHSKNGGDFMPMYKIEV